MFNPLEYLVGAVIVFIVIRALYWLVIEIPRDHAKDEAICETCFKKLRDDEVTEPLEWCDCPQRDTNDTHSEDEN